MQGDAGLRIPKIAVTVDLVVEGCEPARVDVYIAEHSDRAYRREYLLDLLEQDAPFLPACGAGDDGWAAYNKATIVWVGVSLSGGDLPVEESDESSHGGQLFDVVREVSVHLGAGQVKRGQLLYSPPQGRSRVSDYLNSPGRFFRLWTPSHVFLINKNYVLRVVEHEVESKGASQ